MNNNGPEMAEYGLIVAGIALLAIVAVFFLGPKVGSYMKENVPVTPTPIIKVVTATTAPCCLIMVTPTRSLY